MWGYQPCLWKMILVGVGAVCTGGLLLLLLYWLPEWGVKGTCTHTSLRDAHTLLLRSTVGNLQLKRADKCKKCFLFLCESISSFTEFGFHSCAAAAHKSSLHSLYSLARVPYYAANDKFSLSAKEKCNSPHCYNRMSSSSGFEPKYR